MDGIVMVGSALPKDMKIGASIARIDGHLKVTGAARYCSDIGVANPTYAVLKTSAISRGVIRSIDDGETRAVAGVIEVLTHLNIGDAIKPVKFFSEGGYVGSSIMPLKSDKIWHDGQIVAMVIASFRHPEWRPR